MTIVYNIIFICFAIGYIPFFLIRLAQAESKSRLLADRCGFLPRELIVSDGSPRIWMHAVSVGEVIAIAKMVDELFKRYPHATLYLSTVTPTGNAVAKKRLDKRVRLFYLPFDISFITQRVIQQINPKVIVLVETELWPNLIISAKRKNIPICVVNGRLSPRSFWRYYIFRRIISSVIAKVSKVAAQTERYRSRFIRIGFNKEDVIVSGTMKYDIDKAILSAAPERNALRLSCGFPETATIWIAASTHEGEEEICLDVFSRIMSIDPNITLVIAPRHIARTKKIIALIKEKGFKWRVADETQCGERNSSEQVQVFVLNTIGQLASIYKGCDYVFVGGSLIRHGGQNPLEAALFSKPIVAGPHIFNFHDVYNDLVKCGGAVVVGDEDALTAVMEGFIVDKEKACNMGKKAAELLRSKQGAAKRNCDLVAELLESL